MALVLTSEIIGSIAAGSGKCIKVDEHNLIVFKSTEGKLRVCANKCVHMGGSFSPDVEDSSHAIMKVRRSVGDIATMQCGLHAWRLNAATMTYVTGSNPKMLGMTMKQPTDTKQPEATVTMNADGSATLTLPEGVGGGCSLA